MEEEGIDRFDTFYISDAAVKKQSRSFKSVIKLDKNFHIYVHVEQGEDEKGRYCITALTPVSGVKDEEYPEETCWNYFLSQGIAGGDFCTSESPSDTRFISLLMNEFITYGILAVVMF